MCLRWVTWSWGRSPYHTSNAWFIIGIDPNRVLGVEEAEIGEIWESELLSERGNLAQIQGGPRLDVLKWEHSWLAAVMQVFDQENGMLHLPFVFLP